MTHLPFRRVAAAATAILLAAPACSVFDTDIKNPNAIEEAALGDPASAPTLANGLNSAVTRMITSVYGPYSVASDELTWVGSRENWGLLDNGDVWGRPVGVAVAKDGSLLVSDDASSSIWRISHVAAPAPDAAH